MAGKRGLNSVITAQLSAGKFIYAHLIKIGLNTTYYYTDAAYDITYDSNTYDSNAFMLPVSSVKEEGKVTTSSMDLSISAVTQTVLSDVLNNGYIHKEVIIQKAFLSDANAVLSSGSDYAVFTIFKGMINGFSLAEGEKTSTITFSVMNHWAFFERISGRVTTKESQDQLGLTYTETGFNWMTKSNKGTPVTSTRQSYIFGV